MQNNPSSFLVINPFGIGDVLFSTPLIRVIKENFPQASISYLCNRRTQAVLKNHPLITETIVYERDEFEEERRRSKLAWARMFFKFIADIKRQKPEVCLDLSLNSQFGFFAWAAGIKRRVGLNYKGRGRFLTQKVTFDGYNDKHVVEYYLDVARSLDLSIKTHGLEVYTDSRSRSFAGEFLVDNGLKDQPIIGVAPCGGQAFGPHAYVKRWPQEKFGLLIERLVKEHRAKVFIFAGPNEKEEVADIMRRASCYRDCYEFTDSPLEEIIALVERCVLFIGNDTGPLRFANALDKKIVALFGPVDERVYGLYPYDPKKHIVITKDLGCRPCYKKFKLPACPYQIRCLQEIGVDEVYNAAKRLLLPQ